jgi:hypothetical protein
VFELRDGLEEEEGERAKFVYQFASAPAPGAAADVAPGVKWMRMPLGGSLAFINVWGLKDGDGWAIVDTGMQTTRVGDLDEIAAAKDLLLNLDPTSRAAYPNPAR